MKPAFENAPAEILACSMLIKRLYEKIMSPILTGNELPRIEMEILLFLANNPEYNTATAIVAEKGYTKSHVSTALKHLEASGYISKNHIGSNRKTFYLKLEDKARPLIRQGQLYQQKFSQILNQGISEDSLRTAWKVLEKMADNAWKEVES